MAKSYGHLEVQERALIETQLRLGIKPAETANLVLCGLFGLTNRRRSSKPRSRRSSKPSKRSSRVNRPPSKPSSRLSRLPLRRNNRPSKPRRPPSNLRVRPSVRRGRGFSAGGWECRPLYLPVESHIFSNAGEMYSRTGL